MEPMADVWTEDSLTAIQWKSLVWFIQFRLSLQNRVVSLCRHSYLQLAPKQKCSFVGKKSKVSALQKKGTQRSSIAGQNFCNDCDDEPHQKESKRSSKEAGSNSERVLTNLEFSGPRNPSNSKSILEKLAESRSDG